MEKCRFSVDPGIPRRKADRDQAGGGVELSWNQFQDGESSGCPEVLPGRVGAVPLTDHVDHGVAATLSWQGSHGNPVRLPHELRLCPGSPPPRL